MADSAHETRRAAREHRCSWCQEPIVVGEVHDRFACFGDSLVQTARQSARLLIEAMKVSS